MNPFPFIFFYTFHNLPYNCNTGNVCSRLSLILTGWPLLHNQSGQSEQPRAPCESQTDFNIQLQ